MDRITHKVRCEQWTKLIEECLASGMNKTAWCREHGISSKTFFYWQRRLREEAYISTIESSSLPTVPSASIPSRSSIDFVEVRLPDQAAGTSDAFRPDVIIRKDSFSVEISNTASTELLNRIGGFLHAE